VVERNQAYLMWRLGRTTEAMKLALSALDRQDTWLDATARCDSLRLAAWLCRLCGNPRYRELLDEAEALIPAIDQRCRSTVYGELGRASFAEGRWDAARAALEAAAADYDAIGELLGAGDCFTHIAILEVRREGAPVRVDAALAAAELRYVTSRHRVGLASLHNTRGEVLRSRGDHAGALAAYRDAIVAYDRSNPAEADLCRANIGATLLALGRLDEARATLQIALARLTAQGRGPARGFVHVALAACTALQGDVAALKDHLDGVEAHPPAADPDVTRLLLQAAAAAPEPQASRARRLAGG
jgi:tetratricopeptide (TPR) repeat protein